MSDWETGVKIAMEHDPLRRGMDRAKMMHTSAGTYADSIGRLRDVSFDRSGSRAEIAILETEARRMMKLSTELMQTASEISILLEGGGE